jgi:hypothetical protein
VSGDDDEDDEDDEDEEEDDDDDDDDNYDDDDGSCKGTYCVFGAHWELVLMYMAFDTFISVPLSAKLSAIRRHDVMGLHKESIREIQMLVPSLFVYLTLVRGMMMMMMMMMMIMMMMMMIMVLRHGASRGVDPRVPDLRPLAFCLSYAGKSCRLLSALRWYVGVGVMMMMIA